MNNLSKLIPTPKSGNENLTNNQQILNYTLKDFWIWSVSDILSNATRGRFAEFIVATAVNIDISKPRDEWAAYDLITPDGIKIEVKSAAYLQSWHQNALTKISFSIKPSRYWDSDTNRQVNEATRHADIYVMCLLKHKDKSTVNPLDMAQWTFYVLSRIELDNYMRSKHSITLASLKRLTNSVDYNNLNKEIYLKNTLPKSLF